MENVETKLLFEQSKREHLLLKARDVIELAKREKDYVFDTSRWRTFAPRVNSKT